MKLFGFGSNTPTPPPPPSHPPSLTPAKPAAKPTAAPGIVGHWKEPDGPGTTEFRGDGSVIEKPASGEIIRGRYSIEAGKLKVKLDGVAEELSFAATIKPDALELKDADGQVTAYQRVG